MSKIEWQHLWRWGSSPEGSSKAGPPARPAAVLPQTPASPTTPDAVDPAGSDTTDIEDTIKELRQTARIAGIARDDPMMPLLQSFARVVRVIGSRTAGSDRTATEASQRIVNALALAKATADAEQKRFEAALAVAQADTVHQVSTAIAKSAEAALTRRVRVFDRNTALIGAGIFVAAAGGSLWGGYRWGSNSTLASVHQTEAGLRAAFSAAPGDAATWVMLMELNSVQGVVDKCFKLNRTFTQKGRRACNIPLWIETLQPSTP